MFVPVPVQSELAAWRPPPVHPHTVAVPCGCHKHVYKVWLIKFSNPLILEAHEELAKWNRNLINYNLNYVLLGSPCTSLLSDVFLF